MSMARLVCLIASGFLLFALSRGLVLFLGHSPQPQFDVTPTQADLGVVAVGQAVDRTFLIRNSGEERLLITGVQSTCQCTVAELPTRAIAPGMSAQLRVTFKAKNAGAKSQSVLIDTNEPVAKQHVIRIIARATPATQP
jgi:hypothetical protein